MQRLDAVQPYLRHRLGGLVGDYDGVVCDCGEEFVAGKHTLARCPKCWRTEQGAAPHLPIAALGVELGIAVSDINKEQAMSRKVSGLARLVAGLRDVHESAGSLADDLMGHQQRVMSEMEKTRSVVKELKNAGDELERANAIFSNGGPGLEDEPASTSSGSAAAATSAARGVQKAGS